jgi:hypothetical protein
LVGEGDPRFDSGVTGGSGLSFWSTEIGSLTFPVAEEDGVSLGDKSGFGGEIGSVSFSGGGEVILVSGISGCKTEIGSGGEVILVSGISGCKTEIGSGGEVILVSGISGCKTEIGSGGEMILVSGISGCKTEIGSGGGDLISLISEGFDSAALGAAGGTIIGVEDGDTGGFSAIVGND